MKKLEGLRIVVWNCARGLHAKLEQLQSLQPDLAVIPECAEPAIVRRKAPDFAYTDADWIGRFKDKGLGVFTFGDLALRRHERYEPAYEQFLPLEVRGRLKLNLLAVWAFNGRTKSAVEPNPAPTRKAIGHYSDFLRAQPSIVAGDFNSSVVWDRPGRERNFAFAARDLEALGLVSAYHRQSSCEFGAEPDPTHFHTYNLGRPFHIDYCFVPEPWLTPAARVTVGAAAEWVRHSDHAPLVVDLPHARAPATGRSFEKGDAAARPSRTG